MRLNPGEASKEQGRPHPGQPWFPQTPEPLLPDGTWTTTREWAQG